MQQRKRGVRPGRLLLVLMLLVLAGVAVWQGLGYVLVKISGGPLPGGQADEPAQLNLEPAGSVLEPEPPPEPEPEPLVTPVNLGFSADVLSSDNAILVRLDDGEVLFSLGSDERVYPASMTKIMTVLLAIENAADLNDTCSISQGALDALLEESASVAGLVAGEELTVRDLLYACLLPSGADAGICLAEYVAGSESAFAERMNEKAQELGLHGTRFANSSGLHHPDQYTTVADMAQLFAYALQNPLFYEVVTSGVHTTAATEEHPDGITVFSTVFMHLEDPRFEGGRILGGKTGYTYESGQCLASLAEKNGQTFILVTVGAKGTPYTEQLHIEDALTVYTEYLQ